MIKIKSKNGFVMNTYDIYEVWRFLMSTKTDFKIFKNYVPISIDSFLKLFLQQTKNWTDYHFLYKKLKPTSTLKNYLS